MCPCALALRQVQLKKIIKQLQWHYITSFGYVTENCEGNEDNAKYKMKERKSEDKDCEPPSKKKKQETALILPVMGDQEVDNDDCNGEEVDRYLAQKAIATNSTISILDYWKRHFECYPSLASLAKRLLCVPAMSVPAERVFSIAGLTISQQRSSLSPDNGDILIFLQKNLPR